MVLKNLSIISHIRVQLQRPDVFSIIDQGYPHPREPFWGAFVNCLKPVWGTFVNCLDWSVDFYEFTKLVQETAVKYMKLI
ncbi:hypothetical protein Avbf_13912 [Armadillidium vulgare]|nr:hypothetical protein Avbf_13912 [Armadillidium vulgare]